MTRPALSSPPTADRAPDARRATMDRAPRPDGGFHHGPRLRRRPAAMGLPAGAPIAHRLPRAKGRGAGTPAGSQAGAGRVIIIGCEYRLFVHTLSKNWAMTVRQIGWLILHPSLGQKTEIMIPCVALGLRSSPRAAVTWRERRRFMNEAPAGHWDAGSPLRAPIARGVRYNWKGPPTKLPLRAPGSLPAQGRIQFRVH